MATYSVVMTTRHLQSWARSRSDSALNPANTVEWTAPIRAQARKAAAACLRDERQRRPSHLTPPLRTHQVIGR